MKQERSCSAVSYQDRSLAWTSETLLGSPSYIATMAGGG
jgi:hypothetical protein